MKFSINSFRQIARRFASVLFEHLPEQGMVEVTPAVVADDRQRVLGNWYLFLSVKGSPWKNDTLAYFMVQTRPPGAADALKVQGPESIAGKQKPESGGSHASRVKAVALERG